MFAGMYQLGGFEHLELPDGIAALADYGGEPGHCCAAVRLRLGASGLRRVNGGLLILLGG